MHVFWWSSKNRENLKQWSNFTSNPVCRLNALATTATPRTAKKVTTEDSATVYLLYVVVIGKIPNATKPSNNTKADRETSVGLI